MNHACSKCGKPATNLKRSSHILIKGNKKTYIYYECKECCRIRHGSVLTKKEVAKLATMRSVERWKDPDFCKRRKEAQSKIRGELHPRWIKDRTELKKSDRKADDSAYMYWRIDIYKRDGFVCKMKDIKCKGRIEAHHILPWRDYPELRYNINNGITLCLFHHPRKRSEELRLIPEFQNLIINKQ